MKILKTSLLFIATFLISASAFAASFTASPSTIIASSTGNVITLTGIATSWSGSPFSLTSGAGGSFITAQSVTSTTAATITVTAGTLFEAVRISDGTNSALITVAPSGWGAVFSDDFQRANAASWGNGWTDPGSLSSIVSNNGIMIGNKPSPWQSAVYQSSAYTSASTDQRVVAIIPAGQAPAFTSSPGMYYSMRLINPGTGVTQYFGGVNVTGTFTAAGYLGRTNSGSLTRINTLADFAYNSTHSYQIDTQVTGTSPTTISVAITDLTTATLMQTVTMTDSTSGLQAAQGSAGTFHYSNSADTVGYSSIAVFTPASVAATAVTMTGPTSGPNGLASSNFTVAVNGSLASNVTVTPSDSAGGGTFTPSSLTFLSGSSTPASQTFTYTPTTTGNKTISVTNTGSLTNPANIIYKSTTSTFVGVTDAAFHFSPGNWTGDTGRGGSTWRSSWNNGAYFSFTWNASDIPTATISLSQSGSSSNTLIYFINGVWSGVVNANTSSIAVQNIVPSSSNTVTFYLEQSTQSARWNHGINTVKVLGASIDSDSTAGTASAPTKWVLIVGDSITEGRGVLNPTASNTNDYSFLMGQGFLAAGYDFSVSACGYQGYMVTGDGTGLSGDVPPYYRTVSGVYYAPSRWQYVDQGVSLLDTNGQISAYGSTNTPPYMIYINLGTNEAIQGISTSDLRFSIKTAIGALRNAAPNAYILIGMPFGLHYTPVYNVAYVTAITNGVNDYIAANPTDTKVSLIDLGNNFSNTLSNIAHGANYILSDDVHPTTKGQALIAAILYQYLSAIIFPSTPGSSGDVIMSGVKIGTTN